MKVLVLNAGSSSIKFQLFATDDWAVLASGAVTRIGEDASELLIEWVAAAPGAQPPTASDPADQAQALASSSDATPAPQRRVTQGRIADHQAGLTQVVAALQETGALTDPGELAAVGHRVVHGGEAFHTPTLVDDDVIAAIAQMTPLAPLHNPANLDGIRVAQGIFPAVPQVAVFDTAFHQTMPRTAYRYAIPEYLYREYRVRRYGFHGTSHHYVGQRAAAMLGKPFAHCNLITLHLGNGASATAIRQGSSVDTTMGMTPLEGLVMGTRCGDLDPAVHFYLCKHLGLDVDTLDDLLNRQSGLLGLCGVNDMRTIQAMAEAGDERAELAIGITCHRLKKTIGAYTAELGEVDAVVFTGGIGENSVEVRARACAGLTRLGIALDPALNQAAAHDERCISTADSPVRVFVIPTNEELQIAREALAALD